MSADLARRHALLATLLAVTACGRREPAPSFEYTLLDGTKAASRDLRGKVLLVNFWATSCSICVAEMPMLVATYQRHAARGFETLAVAMRHNAPALVAEFAARRALPFGVVIDSTGTIAERFGPIMGTPTSFLIDKQGAIVRRYVGAPDFDALNALIERLLAEA